MTLDEEFDSIYGGSSPSGGDSLDAEFDRIYGDGSPSPVAPRRLTREERIAANNRAIETARSQEDPGLLSAAGSAIAEGAKGAGRAVKDIGGGIVGMASGAVRLAGTPVRMLTGWEGLHRLADTIDSSYENFGRDALMSEYGENPDDWGYAIGRAGEKVAGVAGSLASMSAGGGLAALGTAGKLGKASQAAVKVGKIAQKSLPYLFGNDAAVRAYDTARENGRSKAEAASLAGLNGAIHFLGFKAFENKSLNKMLGMPAEMEAMMPKWAGEAAEAGGQTFTSLSRGVRNGMIKYTLAERGKGALRAGGIMGLQNLLSDPVMQVAEGASIDDIDFSRMLKAGAHGAGEGALMEGALGAAAVFKSPKAAEKFIADRFFRGIDYEVRGADGKMHKEPGLLQTAQGRMTLMKQNPDATERVLDIVEHGGKPRPEELDAAFLPPDMTTEELKKFAADWRKDFEPYVDEAWAADAPRESPAPAAPSAGSSRDFATPDEAREQQKAINDAAERQKVADRRKAADSMMLDFQSWNRLYAQGKTDLNFDEWRAAGKPGVIEADLSTTPKEETDEAGNLRDEEPAQPEQGEVVEPPAGEAAKPVEGAETRREAPDAGVVDEDEFVRDENGRIKYPIEDTKKYIADELAKIGKTRDTATNEDLDAINKKREELVKRHRHKAIDELPIGYYSINDGSFWIRKNQDGSLEYFDDAKKRLENGKLSDPKNKWVKIGKDGTLARLILEGDCRQADFESEYRHALQGKQPAENEPATAPEPPQTSEKPPASASSETKQPRPQNPRSPQRPLLARLTSLRVPHGMVQRPPNPPRPQTLLPRSVDTVILSCLTSRL